VEASTPRSMLCSPQNSIRNDKFGIKKAFTSSHSDFFMIYISMYSDFMINADFDTFCALNLNKICLV
jgi:hypothetical protein